MTIKQHPAGSRPCPVKDCPNPAPPAIPMCKKHWEATPVHLKGQITRALLGKSEATPRQASKYAIKHATYDQALAQAMVAIATKEVLRGRK